ncbi:MAG TPA: ABC transporter substrate-binding protein [Ramlibacter sp.]|nr:ABC transporter substrate-binding protein [Ramlibacter sp.]
MKVLLRTAFTLLLTAHALHAGAQAPSKAPILIGQTYVQTGPVAGLSKDPNAGIRALLTAVNASGGVKGRQLELRQADDGFDASRAAENVKSFAEAGAVAILMPIGTTSSEGALQAAGNLKIPLVGPYTGANSVAKFTEFGFPVRISFDEEYGRIVNHLYTVGLTRIAFVHNENPGARAAMEATRRAIEKRGQSMLGSAALQQDGSDAAAQAKAIAALKPNAIVLAVTNQVASKFIPAYRAMGAEGRFYSFSFLNGTALHKTIGADAAGVVVSQVVPNPWNAGLPLIAEYQAAMKKIGEPQLSYGSLEGYISAKILVEALKRAGDTPTPATVKRALESFKEINLGGVHVRYAPNDHAGLSFSELSMIKPDGSYAR